ncbi:MAG: hypothetical protein ACE5I9_11180 [Candidatus Methylomirabilales bacterium]
MKRFRIFGFDFDARVHSLTLEIQDHWEEKVKELHRRNREQTELELVWEFGEASAEQKGQNFIDLGPKPLSILAFHNRFFQQIRVSFVMGAYYPTLTASCALGERILNHLILTLRDEFKATPEYRRVYHKDSFDNWDTAIDTLEAWKLLLPQVVVEFRELRDRRNEAIHFRPEVDKSDRTLALGAIGSLGSILGNQFGAFGPQPWFITGIPGETYIKKSWENNPFIRKIYLPNCLAVGPKHKVESVVPWVVKDDYQYEEREVTDEEFCILRRAGRGS